MRNYVLVTRTKHIELRLLLTSPNQFFLTHFEQGEGLPKMSYDLWLTSSVLKIDNVSAFMRKKFAISAWDVVTSLCLIKTVPYEAGYLNMNFLMKSCESKCLSSSPITAIASSRVILFCRHRAHFIGVSILVYKRKA